MDGFDTRRVITEHLRETPGTKPAQLEQRARNAKFVSNYVSTTKYNLFTFLPKCLFEQFRRVANIFFLLCAVISLTPISSVTPVTNVLPLVFVLTVSLVKEGIEDWQRYTKDREINNATCLVLGQSGWVSIRIQDVQVGDILQMRANEFVRADMVLLAVPENEGVAYVETANLDGETNLKPIRALDKTQSTFTTDETLVISKSDATEATDATSRPTTTTRLVPNMAALRGTPGQLEVLCDAPNNMLYTFHGALYYQDATNVPDIPPTPASIATDGSSSASTSNKGEVLGPGNVLLRGCTVRNTHGPIIGLAVYTGHETKVMLNASAAPAKRSHMERRLDHLIYIMFGFLLCTITLGATWLGVWTEYNGTRAWYLALTTKTGDDWRDAIFDGTRPYQVGFINLLTLILLFSTYIPISLYVTIEVVKFLQANITINLDRNMYDPVSDTPARARTSNINEELGQVEYLLSDKTGTLTQNLMEFLKCSIAGVSYGEGVTETELNTKARREGKTLAELAAYIDVGTSGGHKPVGPRERGMNFEDARVMDGAWRRQPQAAAIAEFWQSLALCHGVIVEGDPGRLQIDPATGAVSFSTQPVYGASSPDDVAITLAAKHVGFYFTGRTKESLVMQVAGPDGVSVRDVHVPLLATLEFTSTRKRMSVLIRDPETNRVRLIMKGADSVVLARLGTGLENNEHKASTVQHLDAFAANGLRTLCVGVRDVPEEEYTAWAAKWREANLRIVGREEAMDAVADEIEHGLRLLGATALEDKLQVGVSSCIEDLLLAGIKMWVLTGDKLETAINVSFACSLLTDAQQQHVVQSVTTRVAEAEKEVALRFERGEIDSASSPEATRMIKSVRRSEVSRQLHDLDGTTRDAPKALYSLILDGAALEVILDDETLCELFLGTALRCQAVVCCRISPLQKALVTKLVKEGAKKITLAIGDGANDVGMIQVADIGVGISGAEGLQAVMASDFSIAQFRFLADLLLVHGSQMHHRITRMLNFFFYKNMAFTLPTLAYGFYDNFSGIPFYVDYFMSGFNLLFTSLPCGFFACLDQETLKTTARRVPQLYQFSQKGHNFHWLTTFGWLFEGAVHGMVCFWLSMSALATTTWEPEGRIVSKLVVSTVVCTTVVLTVSLRLLAGSTHWTILHLAITFGSIAVYFLAVGVGSFFISDIVGIWTITYGNVAGWLVTVGVVAVNMSISVAYMVGRRVTNPWDWQIVQEWQSTSRSMYVPKWAYAPHSGQQGYGPASP